MNLDEAMELQLGPGAVLMPDAGTVFTTDVAGVTGLLKLAPGDYPHFKFSAVQYTLLPGAALDLAASLLAGRILYCLEGDGEVLLNGERMPFGTEVFVHLGEGHYGAIENTGPTSLKAFVFTFGASPDARPDLMAIDGEGGLRLVVDAQMRRLFGLLDLEQAQALPAERKGTLIHQLPDTGLSWWQARPTAGWVEVKMAPFTCNVHHYAVLMQTIYPGNHVREHAHNQLNELLLVSKGTAKAALHCGEPVICPTGSLIIAGRNVFHWWGNAGEDEVQNFAIIDPPGVEGALAYTGRLREKGTDWPTDIVRNAETGKLLHDRFGFVIQGNAADAQR